MKKLYAVLVLIMILFSSCSSISDVNSDAAITPILEDLLDAIQNKDKAAVLSMFSLKSIDESENLEDDITCLFDYIAEVNFAKEYTIKNIGETTYKSIDHGHKTTDTSSYFSVEFDSEAYLVAIKHYADNADASEINGVYSVLFVKESEKDNYLDKWKKDNAPGIHVSIDG